MEKKRKGDDNADTTVTKKSKEEVDELQQSYEGLHRMQIFSYIFRGLIFFKYYVCW